MASALVFGRDGVRFVVVDLPPIAAQLIEAFCGFSPRGPLILACEDRLLVCWVVRAFHFLAPGRQYIERLQPGIDTDVKVDAPLRTPSAAVPPKVKGALKRPAEPAVQSAPVLTKAVTVRKRPAACALPQSK